MGRRYKSSKYIHGAELVFWEFGELRPLMDCIRLRFWWREDNPVYEITFPGAQSALRHKAMLIDKCRERFEAADGRYAAPHQEVPPRGGP